MSRRHRTRWWRGWVLGAGLSTLGCLGGAVPQAPACAAYVACIQAQDTAAGLSTNLTRFEPSGDCWGGHEIAQLCTSGCARALERLRTRAPSLPVECAP